MIVIKVDTETNKKETKIVTGFNNYGKIKRVYNPITKRWEKVKEKGNE